MRCLSVDSSGMVLVLPEGAACGPSDLVALSQVEADKALLNPFNLTVEESYQVGGAVLLVWCVAWVFRMIARALNVDSGAVREDD